MKKYTEPFCIIGSKGKFAECYGAYLPPLEFPDEPNPEPKVKQIITHIHIDPRTLELDKRLRKAEVTLKGISNFIAKSKPKRRFSYK